MKTILLVASVLVLLALGASAQQFTPPAMPAGAKGNAERIEAEVLKVYSLQDQGSSFRAYVVKYKEQEVVVSDDLQAAAKNVGDKISFMVTRIELPVGGRTIKTISFKLFELSKGENS